MSAIDAAIQKKIYGSGTTALIILNGEVKDKTETIQSIEESGLLIKDSETFNNKAKEEKGICLLMLLGTLAPSVLGGVLTR